MSGLEVPGTVRIPVAVLAERRPGATPWAEWSWRAVEVLEDAPDLPPWTVLREEAGRTLFLAGRAEVELHQPQEIAAELRGDADVEPVEAAQLGGGRRIAAAHRRHQRVHRVARRELEEQEQAREDDDQRRQARREPAQREEKDPHGAPPLFRMGEEAEASHR